jgi:hypothetical protein
MVEPSAVRHRSFDPPPHLVSDPPVAVANDVREARSESRASATAARYLRYRRRGCRLSGTIDIFSNLAILRLPIAATMN